MKVCDCPSSCVLTLICLFDKIEKGKNYGLSRNILVYKWRYMDKSMREYNEIE